MLSEPIFEIGPFKFHMYGFMVAVGVAAALFILYFFGSRKKVSEKFLDFVFYNTLAAVLGGFGSAALFQAVYDYIENPSAGFSFNGGITFIGGLIGGVVVFLAVYFILRPRLDGRLTQMISIIPPAAVQMPMLWAFLAIGILAGIIGSGISLGKTPYKYSSRDNSFTTKSLSSAKATSMVPR